MIALWKVVSPHAKDVILELDEDSSEEEPDPLPNMPISLEEPSVEIDQLMQEETRPASKTMKPEDLVVSSEQDLRISAD